MNLNLLRTQLNENLTFDSEALPVAVPRTWYANSYFGILSTILILKFSLSTESFFQVERTFLVHRDGQKLVFTHSIAYA